ncbi:MAG: glutathione peroxidase [Actinomycetota bacterium]|nr:glutathione peroxidase [Actinomycetota bacterium]
MATAHDFEATTIDGETQALSDYKGKVMLVVNTASKCGFTPQYEGLETLYESYADRGLVVLGFPCDQFGNQEPGDEEEIKSFCSLTYNVTFPMFAKVDVKGEGAHPLFAWLKDETSGPVGGDIKWNFTKFLIDPDGKVVERYETTIKPEALTADVEGLLPD